MIHIRLVNPALDLPYLLDLWQCAFATGDASQTWPVTPAWFSAVAMDSGQFTDHLLAEIDGQRVGFALVQVNANDPTVASLLALAVLPSFQHHGVGQILHQTMLKRLRARGVRQIRLAAGAQGYFWPGVPAGLPCAWPFFQRAGWREAERSFDLVRSLSDYHTPAWVWQRLEPLGLELVTAGQSHLENQVLEMVSAEYPRWLTFFARAFHEGRARDVLLAYQEGSGKVLGACLIESHSQRWDQRLPQPAGAPGCFLTAQTAQNRGIGMALVARTSEILQERGCRTSFIGWTWLVDWYGKLGYRVWQEYIMSWLDLPAETSPVSAGNRS